MPHADLKTHLEEELIVNPFLEEKPPRCDEEFLNQWMQERASGSSERQDMENEEGPTQEMFVKE
jgi:DNA-directed RNA polymerase specialized sigma54-like protein